MKTWKRFTAPLLAAIVAYVSLAAVTQLHSLSGNEAPSGFETPTLAENPGSQSHGNGLVDDATAWRNTSRVSKRKTASTKRLGPLF